MNSRFQFKLKSRHLLVCLAIIFLHQTVVGAVGKQKHLGEQVNLRKIQNASERQDAWSDGSDSLVVSAIRRILPEVDSRLNNVNLPRNFLQIVLNASGVLGLGFLWIKEISAALGTPILAPILMPPLLILAAALLLIPDLSRLGELLENAMSS